MEVNRLELVVAQDVKAKQHGLGDFQKWREVLNREEDDLINKMMCARVQQVDLAVVLQSDARNTRKTRSSMVAKRRYQQIPCKVNNFTKSKFIAKRS